jgi:hypothetical protein
MGFQKICEMYACENLAVKCGYTLNTPLLGMDK